MAAVTALLEMGASPGLRDSEGATAADLARKLGHAEALAPLEQAKSGRMGGLF